MRESANDHRWRGPRARKCSARKVVRPRRCEWFFLRREFQMAKTSPGMFVQQVRQEMAKVSWPSRRETTVSVALVFVFALVLGTYFLIVDRFLTWGVSLIFG